MAFPGLNFRGVRLKNREHYVNDCLKVGHAEELRPWYIRSLGNRQEMKKSSKYCYYISKGNCLCLRSAFQTLKNCCIYYLIAYSAGTHHFIHLSLSHTHTHFLDHFWDISFIVALIKADCDILLNSAPIKTWHCLKHYQMMLSSVRALVLRPSIFIKEQVPIFLLQRWNCKVASLFTGMW